MSEKPEDSIRIKKDGSEKDVLMSFGMLNELAALVDDPDEIPLLVVNPGLRGKAINIMLAERDANGAVAAPVNPHQLGVSLDDVNILLDWAVEHVLSFFLTQAEKAKALTLKYAGRAQSLMSSSDGTPVSA